MDKNKKFKTYHLLHKVPPGHSVRKAATGGRQRYTQTDMTFFCIFPLLFLIFNIIYWWSVAAWRYNTWNIYSQEGLEMK